MSHPFTASYNARRLAVAVAAVLAAACNAGSGDPAPAASVQNPGVVGSFFEVVVARPEGGTVRSSDGAIVCGTGGLACSARYAWTAQVVLTATPDPGYMFGTWAGDCHQNPCVLDTRVYGADKFVVAVFGLGDDGVLHGNFYAPALHGPAFLDRLAGLPGTFNCSSTACHGPTYDGNQSTPSCNACHAAAGWTGWRTNCTFCHGTRTPSGYDFAADPARAAPPDAISERLDGSPAPARAGAHRQHLSGTTTAGAALSRPFPCAVCHAVPADLSHVDGATARASVVLAGAGHASLPVDLGAYAQATGTCSVYCHGDGRLPGLSPSFATTVLACDGCHGVPPRTGHPYAGTDLTVCAGCHPATMTRTGAIVAGGGSHVDGTIQGTAACDSCHAFPPPSGAHVKHFGLVGTSTSAYGDTRALQDMFAGATPPTAPAVYAFGCGSCHPLDGGRHLDGRVDVELADAAAPAGSLKGRAAPTARWDAATGTCSGVYCHSSGQETPAYGTTPPWTAAGPLACGSCHGNPPRYASGGAGSATANSHLAIDVYAWVAGHFGGVGAFGHADRHGNPRPVDWPGDDTAITCQTCHYDTTDPARTGASGFYWLDTTGDYELPGRDPGQGDVSCVSCHTGAGNAGAQAGRVLPLRHVNGARDVVFDPRSVIDRPIAYLPPAPSTPERPYYRTNSASSSWVTAILNGTTRSFNLAGSQYDAATKTCTVACHTPVAISGLQPRWGQPFEWNCDHCHVY